MEINLLVAVMAFFAVGFLSGALFGVAAGRCVEKDRVYDPLRQIAVEAAEGLKHGEQYGVVLRLSVGLKDDDANVSTENSLTDNLYQNWMYQ